MEQPHGSRTGGGHAARFRVGRGQVGYPYCMMERISDDLGVNERRLANILLWPKNLGIEFRRIRITSTPALEALLISVDGLSSAEGLANHVLKPLAAMRGPLAPPDIVHAITVARQRTAGDCDQVVEAVLDGYAALLVEGWNQAVVLDVVAHAQHHAGPRGRDPNEEMFARDLRVNLALIRKRLRDPKLRAFRVNLIRPHRGSAALLFLEGKADPTVVRAIRRWTATHLGEEAVGRGLVQSGGAVLGLLPRFHPIRWTNQAAVLLDGGYVMLLVDGIHQAYAAPVTYAGWLVSPSDYGLIYPLKRWLGRVRTLCAFLALILPATVVALLNYHQEMVPVGFLLAVASARESAPFGIFFEILGGELLVEAGREASFRLPMAVPVGLMLVATVLIVLMAVQTGFVGPVPALTTAVGAVLSLVLPSSSGTYVVRIWRLYLMLGAVIMGYFGIAAGLFILLTYLHQANSWGVPFLGPSGWELTAAEGASSRRAGAKGGKRVGKDPAAIR